MTTTLAGGYALELDRRAAAVRFQGPRRTLSTAALNGGLREDLTAVFNLERVDIKIEHRQ